jgi:hypothetical protein
MPSADPHACTVSVPPSCRAGQGPSAAAVALAILAASLGGAWAEVLVGPEGTPAPPRFAGAMPAASAAEPDVAPGWTQVRIEAGGRSVVVPAPQAQRLAPLLARLWAAESEPAAAGGAVALSLEVARGSEALGVLELVGNRWRWTPEGLAPRLLRASPGLSAATREEAERLLRP